MPSDGDSVGKGTAQPTVFLSQEEVEGAAVSSIVIEQDVDQADMCTLVLRNTNDHRYTETVTFGSIVEVKFADTTTTEKTTVFKGEVVGFEPCFEVGGDTHCVVRAFSMLHRLSRGKKSKTFEKMTDADIARKIITTYNGLACKVEGNFNLKYDHVYQHHQTDLEFLLMRAKRINFELCAVPDDEKTVIFRKRDVSKSPTVTLAMGEKDDAAGLLTSKLQLRLSSANQITEVKIRCWDPNKATEIIGQAKTLNSSLNAQIGGTVAKKNYLGGTHSATFDVPVTSKQEADAVAQSILEDTALNYVTGEAVVKGSPKLKAGITVKVVGTDKRFDGKYYVSGCTHRYSHKASGAGGGFLSVLRLKSNGTAT